MRVRPATWDCALRWAPFLSEIDATHDHYGEHSALYGYERSWPTSVLRVFREQSFTQETGQRCSPLQATRPPCSKKSPPETTRTNGPTVIVSANVHRLVASRCSCRTAMLACPTPKFQKNSTGQPKEASVLFPLCGLSDSSKRSLKINRSPLRQAHIHLTVALNAIWRRAANICGQTRSPCCPRRPLKRRA
jgi:hypothetical protein